MRGKAGIMIGLAAGYVLGARAGRERYDQIKTQWLKVWNLDPVQDRVGKVKEFARSGVLAVPGALFDGVVKVTKAVRTKGSPGEKLDAALAESKDSAENVKAAAEETAETVEKATKSTKSSSSRSSSSRSNGTRTASSKSSGSRSTSRSSGSSGSRSGGKAAKKD